MRKHIYLILAACGIVVMSIWHIELTSSSMLTNGFMYFDNLIVYHVSMYALFVSCLFLGAEAIYANVKLEGSCRQ